jgi:1-acyl-sn-glycerol-3-phosphate acyltransferase
MNLLFSIAYWIFFSIVAILLYPVAVMIRLATCWFDPNGRRSHWFTGVWSQIYLRCLPGFRMDIQGDEKIEPGKPYILVANHQSFTDIMALGWMRVMFKWVSKKEAFRLPLVGWNMYLNRYIKVDRGNVRSVVKTMDECRAWLAKGVPLMMFPEGHRYADGQIHPFHGGSFKLAVECGCPVIPIVIDGTGPIYHGFRVNWRPGTVRVRVLDPIAPVDAGNSVVPLRDMVRERMIAALAELRGRKDRADAVSGRPINPEISRAG